MLLFLLVGYLLYTAYRPSRGADLAFWKASLTLGLIVVISSEGLALFSALNAGVVASFWVLVTLGLAAYLRKNSISLWEGRQHLLSLWMGLPAWLRWLSWAMLATLLVQVFLTPPNTWDALTYHLARTNWWIQQGNLDYWPTHNDRHLYQPPLAEWFILHTQLLSGSDVWAGTIQYMALWGAIVLVGAVARHLGLPTEKRGWASLGVLLLPAALLQGVSTQNDLFFSFWILAAVYGLLLLRKQNQPWTLWLWTGIAVGLALLTKGTGVVWLIPFFLLWGLGLLRKAPQATFLGGLGAILLILVLNAGHWSRNYALFGNLTGTTPEAQFMYANQSHHPGQLLSLAVRNLALHSATLVPQINYYFYKATVMGHQVLGLDVNDPSTTFPDQVFGIVRETHEDVSGNLLALVVGLGLGTWYVLRKGKSRLNFYLIPWILGFLAFIWIFRWQPWHTRLHLPWWLLFVPMAAYTVSTWNLGKPALKWGLSLMLGLGLLTSIFHVVFNSLHTLAGPNTLVGKERNQLYYVRERDLYLTMDTVAQVVARYQPKVVGLQMDTVLHHDPKQQFDPDFREYPLHQYIRNRSTQSVKLVHIGVVNTTKHTQQQPPCDVLVSYHRDVTHLDGQTWRNVWQGSQASVYIPASH